MIIFKLLISWRENQDNSSHLINIVEHNEVVAIGGFIGKTIDGLETTYERGGSDRTAADGDFITRPL